MAHNLTFNKGKYEFAYFGESPWHNLGQRLPSVATATEIMQAAGLNWVVLPEPLQLKTGEDIRGFVANVRSDTREVLGIVSTDYRQMQNGDAFKFMEDLVTEATAMFHTAGSIRRGRQVFASAKLPQSIIVTPQDVVDQYLLLVNNHDGEGGLHLRFTPIRVVCNNTLSAALAGSSRWQYSIRHVGDLQGNLREARQALGLAERYFKLAGSTYRALSAKQITARIFDEQFLPKFLPLPTIEADAPTSDTARTEIERIKRDQARVAVLFDSGLGTDLPGVRGTAWGAFNAAVEWSERVRSMKKNGTPRSGQQEAVIFGVGQDYRQRAMDAALSLL